MNDRIQQIDVILASPGRNFVTLKLTTADGLVGFGDATVNGRELAVATNLQEHIAPLLMGRDPGKIEDVWQYLYRGIYWRRGPINMACIGAVDMALWDILGKRTGQPIYQLLGGEFGIVLMSTVTASDGRFPSSLNRLIGRLNRVCASSACSHQYPVSRRCMGFRATHTMSQRIVVHYLTRSRGILLLMCTISPVSWRRFENTVDGQ